MANQMLRVCIKKHTVTPERAMLCGAATFCLRIEGIYEQVNALSSEKLGFIVGMGLGSNTVTPWRKTALGQTDSLIHFFPPGSWNPGRHVLVGLARLVISAAIYDILITEYILKLLDNKEKIAVEYMQTHKLRKFVKRVRLGQKT